MVKYKRGRCVLPKLKRGRIDCVQKSENLISVRSHIHCYRVIHKLIVTDSPVATTRIKVRE